MTNSSAPEEPSELVSKVRDRSELANLYPTPKTYDQRQQDTLSRQKLYRRRLPKYPHVNIATYGASVFGCIILFAQNVSSWWAGDENKGVTMSLVFLSFAIVLVLAASFILWVNYTIKLFSYFEGATKLFWLIYAILVSILLAIWANGWILAYTDAIWLLLLTTVYFLIVLVSARAVIIET